MSRWLFITRATTSEFWSVIAASVDVEPPAKFVALALQLYDPKGVRSVTYADVVTVVALLVLAPPEPVQVTVYEDAGEPEAEGTKVTFTASDATCDTAGVVGAAGAESPV